MRRDLSTKLASYRTAASGHKDNLSHYKTEDLIHVDLYRLAP